MESHYPEIDVKSSKGHAILHTQASETRLFTPTAKNIIAEIATVNVEASDDKGQPSSTRRSICFGTLSDLDDETTFIDLLPKNSAIDSPIETPLKKNKGKATLLNQ